MHFIHFLMIKRPHSLKKNNTHKEEFAESLVDCSKVNMLIEYVKNVRWMKKRTTIIQIVKMSEQKTIRYPGLEKLILINRD